MIRLKTLILCAPFGALLLGFSAQADSPLASASSSHPQYPISLATDENPATYWHTDWGLKNQKLPAWLQVDLQQAKKVTGFRYAPRADRNRGRVARYSVQVSQTGKDFRTVVPTARFPDSGDPQTVLFAEALSARFLRLVIESSHGEGACTSRHAAVAEFRPLIEGEPQPATISPQAERPNILWITLEDTSPHFIGCYGNEAARTPNIDGLAARGIRFDCAFANSPVCSSARSTIITGALTETLGTGHHRSRYPLPEEVQGFPTFLREAGYYTSNNEKTDYSTSSAPRLIRESWNESSRQAHWEKRAAGQPFFSVFNIEDSHQSRTMTWSYHWYRENIFQRLASEHKVEDSAFPLPPFLPETPECRKHFARVYNSIARADEQVGEILDRLDDDGLTEDTIIFCYADHGEAMPRGKGNPIGLGYRVPFIVSFPDKWKHLNPWGENGTASEELVNFDDLGPTMLSLVGQKPAPWMTGRPLLGQHREEAPRYTFCSRNRIDPTLACSRSVTDGRYLYTRNFRLGPEYPYMKYFDVADLSRLLREANAKGELNEVQRGMFQPGAPEVLYDLVSDPWELNNLAANKEHTKRVNTLREALFQHILEGRDVMMLPEYELALASQKSTPHHLRAQLSAQEFQQILRAADLASRPGIQPEILDLLTAPSPIVRYWAATALCQNGDYPRTTTSYREIDYPPAEIELASARVKFDNDSEAIAVLTKFILASDPLLQLQALQNIQGLGARAATFEQALRQVSKSKDYETRCSAEMTLYLLGQGELSYPDPL